MLNLPLPNAGVYTASPSIRWPKWNVSEEISCLWRKTQGHITSGSGSRTFYTTQWLWWCFSRPQTHVVRNRGINESSSQKMFAVLAERRELLMWTCVSEPLNNWWGLWESTQAPSVTLVNKNRCCPWKRWLPFTARAQVVQSRGEGKGREGRKKEALMNQLYISNIAFHIWKLKTKTWFL